MQRRKFSREFKVEAVKLVRERGVSAAPSGSTGLRASPTHLGHRLPFWQSRRTHVCSGVLSGPNPSVAKIRPVAPPVGGCRVQQRTATAAAPPKPRGRVGAPDVHAAVISFLLKIDEAVGPVCCHLARRRGPEHTQLSVQKQKKTAWFPRRPFLSHGGRTYHRAISELPDRGPISRSSPARQPLHIGTVAICCPNRRDGLPSP